jgi:uncharacterized protein with HEPN domain
MSKHEIAIALQHMLDHAQEAIFLVQGKTRADLDENRTLNLALTRLLEIIGEAANRVPIEFQMENPAVSWPQIISLRNRLIHGYDSVDFDLLWYIVTHDLPELIQALEKILAKM